MIASQYILSAIILFILFKTLKSYSHKKITKSFAALWIAFWILALAVVIHPYLTTNVARILGIGRGVDLALYLSIILIFYLLFRLRVKQKEIEDKITKIVREIASK